MDPRDSLTDPGPPRHRRAAVRRGRPGGFTVIELACVLSVIAVLLGLAMPGLHALVQHRRLEGLSLQLDADLQHLRSEAVARNTALRMRFQRDALASCYVIHSGPAGSCTCLPAAGPTCSAGGFALHQARLPMADGVVLHANVGSMRVDPRQGTVSPAGSIQLDSASGRAIRHVVNILGRVRTCVPAGAPGVGLVAREACAS
jgi:type IV fimbrial biogenesis protein FimT